MRSSRSKSANEAPKNKQIEIQQAATEALALASIEHQLQAQAAAGSEKIPEWVIFAPDDLTR
jgi:hypothetical protein